MNTSPSHSDRIAALPEHLRSALAQRLAGRGGATSAAAAPLVPAVPRDGDLRMSFGQERLWFLEDFAPGSADYHSALPVRIDGPLDEEALRGAVGDLVSRHEALRTTFDSRNGVGVQIVHDRLDPGWVTAAADGEEAARKTVRAEMARPYDLRTGPLVRVLLVRLGADAHLCVLGMHHVVTDGWSMGVIADELGELYAARSEGRPATLPAVTVQYPDYAAWQRDRMADGGPVDEQLDWWRAQLKGLAPLEMPTDRPRPAVRSSAGAVHSFELPAETVAGLKELARERGATLFMALTAAVKAVFARWSGQEDIAVGTSSAARGHQDLERLVGFLVNTVVLRTQAAPELTFTELLARVKDTVLDAFAHEDVPFDRLVEAVQPERDLSRTALVQAMVVLQNTPTEPLTLAGSSVSPYVLERNASLFDLTFEFEERDGCLRGLVEYSTELFEERTVARMAGHLGTLLAGAVADPDRPVADLPMLTDQERRQVAFEWNATELPSGDDALIHERLAAQAARTPDEVALVAEDATLTHRELDERANRLAHHLVTLGAGPGSLVGLSVERGSAMAVGLLGILKAGAAYVPLDPAFPGDRLGYMLADSGARIVVSQSAVRDRLPERDGLRIVDLDAEREAIGRRPGTPPPAVVAPHDLAYVIYTSGSTGNPKGVAVEHRNVRHILAAWDERYGLADLKLRFLSVSSLSVDLFFADLIRSLPFSGALIIASKDVTTEPSALLGLIAESGATGLEIVPSLLNAVLQEVERRGEDFPPLRLISVGSEGWRVEDCRALLGRVQRDCVVVNAYGGTEATVDSTVFVPTEESLRAGVYVPIGRPLPNTRAYVLDAHQHLVPQGVPGEIWIGGEGVARGYHGRPELTAERFTDNPFVPGDRLYRTGDRARWLASGDLEFLGRADDQVKIRGFRIELGEVESALLTHPDVRDAAVLAWQEDSGRRRLVAYVVTEDASAEARTSDLRAHLSGRLPDYMVPAVFVTLAGLPLTPSGKVDRRSLPEPEVQAGRLGTEYAAPRDAIEETLAEVWADVLGVERVGIHDNFFDLGGDSILSIQVVSRARQAGLHFTSKLLFLHQSIAALSGVVTGAEQPSSGAPAVVSGRVELTPIQRWFLQEHTVDPDHYAMSVHLGLAPGTDPALLERALDAVVAHHDALRLRYTRQGAEWIQEYGDRPTGILTVRDIRDAQDTERALNDAALEAQRALDLSAGTLIKGVQFLLGDEAAPRLFLAVHHIVMDGVSWRVLLEDLATAYDRLARNLPADLGAKSSSYQQWAERLTAHVRGGGLDHEAGHWHAVDAANAPSLPVDHPAGRNITEAEQTVEVRLGAEETETLLHRIPSVYRTQINDILVTALGRTLAEWTGSDRLVLGLEGHGREELFDDLDLSRTVGWYTTHFPAALTLPAGGWDVTVKSVKEQLRAIPGRGLGYDALRFLSLPGTPGHALRADPLPPISFNYLGQWDGTTAQDGLVRDRLPALGHDHATDEPRPYLLDVVGMVEDGSLGFTWIFSDEVFDRSTVERVAHEHLTALRALLAHCQDPASGGATPSDFPLAGLDQAAVDRIAGDGRDVADVYPLTPMQSGMLFHTLAEPGSGAYFEQMSFVLDGVRDPALLEQAWQHVTDHLDILRGSVVWERVDRPLLVVRRRVETPVTHLDWRGESADEQARALESYLAADRARGIDLSAAPLMRMALVRTSDTSVRVVRTSHHVLLDGWSTFQMLDEVTWAYRALQDGEQPALPARRPFRAYVEWLERQDLTEAEAYWRTLLDGFDEPTALPYDRRPAATHRAQSAERLVTRLSADASRGLYDFARTHRLTVNAVIQGAWALLLSRYAGERDIVFGATVSGRPAELPGADSMVGMLINTLPVRVGIDGDAPVGEWLARLQQAQVEARQYEYVPLPRIQGWSDVARGTNLFDSLVAFENFPVDGDTGHTDDGVRLHGLEGADVTNFPLNLVAYAGEELAYALAYDPELFDAATIDRMAGHLRALLTGMADAPAQPVSALSMLGEGEWERVVREWAVVEGSGSWSGTVHGRVAEWAALSPDAVAVSFAGESLTYGELEVSANRLAHRLVGLGAGPGELVGLSVERGVGMVVGLLGILKSGAAYVPLDPAYPADRLAFMLEDSGAGLLVTEGGLVSGLPVVGVRVVDLVEGEWGCVGGVSVSAPVVSVSGSDVAYVIYTSGSTGRPKGVAVEHRSVLHLMANCESLYGFGVGDVWSVFHSYAFDFSVWELWGALMSGGRAVVVGRDTARSPEAMWGLLRGEGVSVLSQTPSMFRELVEDAAVRGEGVLPDLRWVVFGGEALEPKHVVTWFGRFGSSGARLVNMYGITETTVHVTFGEIVESHVVAGGRLPVGRPLPGYRVYLLDECGGPVPVGVAGEIYVGGGGLARGYLGRSGLTAERFVLDPFGVSGERMYRSGDVGRWRADGTLEHLGRADDQVKVRGFRIELGEIEAVLVGHGVVRECVVVAHEGVDGHRRLVAYVVSDGELPVVELRAFVGATLPDYMVPALFVALDGLPLTPSGKVDRRALPEPEVQAEQLGARYCAPRDRIEEVLAAVWAEVLGVEKVGIHDNFFELGGDSILSIQIISHARQTLGAQLSPRLLFEAPTVAQLAAAIAPEEPARALPAPAIPVVPRDGVLPMSFGQQRLWFLEDFNEGGTEYHSAVGLRLTGPLDRGALRAAVSGLMARHEALRTTFDVVDGQGVQVVHPALEPEWRTEEATSEEQLRTLAQEDLTRPYDLRNGPLVRVLLVRLAADEHVCVLGMHHIVTDGWSMGVASRELDELYAAHVESRAANLPEVAVQYPDFAAWQRGRLEDGGLLEEQLGWWREHLDGVTPLELPTDRPRPTVRSSKGGVVAFDVPAATTDGLKELARARGVTLFMALTAAVKAVFARYTGQRDIAVGTASAGRSGGDLEQLVGFLVNTVVLRSHIDPETPFDSLLGQVKETVLDAFAHEDVPFERVVEAVQPERDTSRTPLVQTMVVLQNAPGMHPGLGDVRVTDYPMGRDTALFDLTLEFEEYEGGLRALAEYSAELFDASTIERFGEHLNTLLAAAVGDPARPVSALPLLGEGEWERVVREWAVVEGSGAWSGTVHGRVAEWAALSPDAVAVSFAGESLTYGELEVSANRLAHRLVGLGAGPGELVGLSVERGVGMVVGLLGILKSGAAYVPLDPAYPADRLAFMLEDSGAGLLVTEGGLVSGLSVVGVRVVDLVEGEWGCVGGVSVSAPVVSVSGSDVAYVIYTSGSTGRPKGVAVEHRSVLHLMANCESLYGFGVGDVWSVFHSYAFDFSVWELWGALMSGGRAVVVGRDTARSPEAMWGLLRGEGVSVLSQTPSMFRELVEDAAVRGEGVLPDLRWVVFGGEALEPKHVVTWFGRFGSSGARLVNMYGITETTVHVTFGEIVESHVVAGGRLPVGRPLPGYRVYLLDECGGPVPVGVAGEIYVGGGGLARGYLGRSGLTAERFVLDPFGVSGERMYRSGDVGRWRADGTLEHLGRADDQVKVRGFRIELGEIEAVLVGHGVVRECVVVAHEGVDGHRRLVAYVVSDGELPVVELRAFVGATLPDYMVPALFVALDGLPLTPSGKVDRRALPEPEVQAEQLGARYCAPRDRTEEVLAAVWAEVLGVEKVGIHDNFFELGGDSILSIQIISHARQAGLQLTSKLMFVHQTVAELAAVVPHADAAATVGEEAAEVSGRVELTPVQRWFFAEHTSHPDRYAMSLHVALAPDTDPAVLERALAACIDRHDALRMRYADDGAGNWSQEYGTRSADLLTVLEIQSPDDAERALRNAAPAAQEELDLHAGALVKGVFLPAGEDGALPRLFLAVHHVVMDGVSWRILLEDLATAYHQLAAGASVDLGAKSSSYQQWARRLTGLTRSGGLDHEIAYWRKAASGTVDIPCDGPATSTYGDVAVESVTLDRAETEALLQRVPAAFRTQINDVLLTALGRVLRDWAGDPVTIALEGHGREELFDDIDLSRTVGWFTTIYPVTLDVPDGPWANALKAVKKALRKLPGRGLGYGALRYLSEPGSPAHAALEAAAPPRISFNYLGQWDGAAGDSGLIRDRLDGLGADQAPDQARPHLLDVVAAVSDGRLRIDWMHAPSAHTTTTVRGLADDFATALRQIAAAGN